MSKYKILLLHTDINRWNNELKRADIFPAIGLGYLASSLRQVEHTVLCLDSLSILLLNAKVRKKSFLQISKELILKETPDIIGITAVSQTRKECLDLARLAKTIDKRIKVVFGGPYTTLMYEQILEYYNNVVDYLVIGEGEKSFIKLVKAIEEGERFPEIPGVCFFKDNKICFNRPLQSNQNLDEIPFPDYSFHASLSQNGKIPTLGLFTSRGRSFRCEFCGSQVIWGKIRLRSPKNVVDEIEYMQNRYSTDTFRIHDDTFTVPRERVLHILKEIVKRGIRAKFYMHTRFETVDKEILELFKEAGGVYVYYGLESGSMKIRKIMGKTVNDEVIIENAKVTKQVGLLMGIFIMLGYPVETISDLYNTYKILKKISPDDVQLSITKIQPKTPLYYRAVEMGIHKEIDWLNEEYEYFTFVQGKERDLIYGFQLLFDKIFKKDNVRNNFERNPEVGVIKKCRRDWEKLQEEAQEQLTSFITVNESVLL